MRSDGPIAFIANAGGFCAVGRGMRQIAASVRAGLGGQRASHIENARSESMTLALVPEDALEPLVAAIEMRGHGPRLNRILRLAAPALRDAAGQTPAAPAAQPPPLFLGLPEPEAGLPAIGRVDLVRSFAEQASIAVDHAHSEVFWNGRAASLMALAAGLRCLREHRAQAVLVGGADTFLDPELLARLDREQRISSEEITDGFIPGEGAAFLGLTAGDGTGAAPPAPQIAVLGAGGAEDAGHRYGTEPARGEGLAHAIDALLTSLPRPPRPIATVFAGFNGESFFAKEWGVAHIRHHDSFAERIRLTHPADCFGDAGAAMGALLMALAGADLARGDGEGPTLVFVSSDRADRACALLDVVT